MSGLAKNIEELQRKLEGVYDLNQVEDCRKMIGVLLRSLKEKDSCGQNSNDQLKLLALMVINGNPKAWDKAREVMAKSGKSKGDVFGFLMNMIKACEDASSMDTKQLVSEVTDTIWSALDMSSRESAVLGELIHRAKKLK